MEKTRGGEKILFWFLPTGFILLLGVNVTQDIYDWAPEDIVAFLMIIAMISTMQSVAIMRETKKNAQKEEALRQIDAQLKTQKDRFAELVEYNRQVRVLRHDIRHHLLVLEGLLSEGNYKEAEQYLKKYGAAVGQAEGAPLCENYVADVIGRYYQTKAAALGAETDFVISLPRACGIADADLCVVLGNLLENAFNASSEAEGEKFIRVRVKDEGSDVLIAVDNSCGGKESPSGTGLGIPSVKAVARAYGGMAKFTQKGDRFEASVLLTKKPDVMEDSIEDITEIL